MCTVSFIPSQGRYFIVSNRDEKMIRKSAIIPRSYYMNGSILVYPKDAEAGGTWIAMNGNGNAAVLLNGAFVKHASLPSYDRSRGLVFTDIISSELPVNFFWELKLKKIEPFTIVILECDNLYECRWDGSQKHARQLTKHQPYIWSSVTLYDKETIEKRRKWFAEWMKVNLDPSLEDVLRFHRFAGDGDPDNDLCMNRNNTMLTVSLTGIEIKPGISTMVYHDLKTNTRSKQELILQPQTAIH